MTRYRLLTTEDADGWAAALPTDACVMGSLEFVRIQERYRGQAARLFVLESGDYRVAYPFFLRPTPPHPLFQEKPGWDTATPEYTGPILLGPETGEQAAAFPGDFAPEFSAYCRSEGIIGEFAHLNPWNAGMELLDPACVEVNREIVNVDLTWSEEAIWQQSLNSDTRRMTKRALDAGVQVRLAESEADVLAFHQLHHHTMERREALDHYYLPPEYFLEIFATMPGNAFFMLSEYQGRIVAGGLYFQDANQVYWHLSAMDMDFSKVRPVNAYHYETIKRASLAGKKNLLCGGAYQPGDGVFRFKAGFSPLRVPFKTYKRIHDPELYAALTADWSLRNGGQLPDCGFFPAYRAGAAEDVSSESL